MWCLSFAICAHLELQHFQPLVCELKERQRGLHDVQGVHHVASHVCGAQVAGRHGAQLQKGIQDARQHLADKQQKQPKDLTVVPPNSDEDMKSSIRKQGHVVSYRYINAYLSKVSLASVQRNH